MKVQSMFARIALLAALPSGAVALAQSAPDAWEEGRASPLGALPLTFIENQGQWDDAVRFVARKGPLAARFEPFGMVLAQRTASEGVAVRLSFEGASGEVWIEGEDPLPGVHNFFVGERSTWRAEVPGYASVLYHGVYAGVDVRVRDRDGRLEYDVLLERAADLERVVVRCDGVDCLEIDEVGNLVLSTALGELVQAPPQTWQVLAGGELEPVECRYRRIDGTRYGFEAPGSEPGLAMVVDPGLEWSTFLGGAAHEFVQDVAIAANGDVVACGQTGSDLFPTSTGAFATSKGIGLDGFVVRMDPTQTGRSQLVYSSFLGGSGEDRANSCSVDDQGVITVVGRTDSVDFPTTPGDYGPSPNGLRDAFVCQLDPSLPGLFQLVYSTLVGRAQNEHGNDHHVDAAGVVTVAGWTQSPGFPTSPGAYDTTHNGGMDAYVLRLDPGLSGSAQLLYSTFLGGSGDESLSAGGQVAVDDQGLITVAGYTASADFPTKPGAYQRGPAGGLDGFVSRLDPGLLGLDQLVASTYLGGTLDEYLTCVDVDTAGVVTVGGQTISADFPTTSGAYQTTHTGAGGEDAFVTRLDPGLTTLLCSTFLAGSGYDLVNGLQADGSGLVTVAGSVGSSNFPTTDGAYEENFQGGPSIFGPFDAFVSRFDPSLGKLLYSTFLGGAASHDFAYNMAVDEELAVAVGGLTQSSDFPMSSSTYDASYAGNDEAFLTKLDLMPTGADPYGASTPGCMGPIAIGVGSMPKSGDPGFEVLCVNAPPLGTGLLGFSLSKLDPPVSVLGVKLLIDPSPSQLFLTLPSISDALGYSEVPVPIPTATAGAVVYAQFLWLPNACGPQGFSTSNALELTIQP